MNDNKNEANIVKRVGKLASTIKSIVKTFTGAGTPKDWIKTAVVIIPLGLLSITFVFLFLFLLVMIPVFMVQDQVHKITNVVSHFTGWFDKLAYIMTGDTPEETAVKNEKKFYTKLEEVYSNYSNKGICIDDTLVSSTLMYKYIVSNNPSIGDDVTIEDDDSESTEGIEAEDTTEEYDYKKMKNKIKPLAKKQIYNNSLSNADFLAYLRTGKKATDEERSQMNEPPPAQSGGSGSGGSVGTTIPGVTTISTGNSYQLTDGQLRGIAAQCYKEQGSVEGAKAEASLMANRFEIYGSRFGSGGDGLYNYIKTSGWFAGSESTMNDNANVGDEIIAAVRDVLVNGNRTLPPYIDEHDCYNCCSYGSCIDSGTNNGTPIDVFNRTQYQQGVTKLHNTAGATYTFYTFPTNQSDPFGYTDHAFEIAGGTASQQPNATTNTTNTEQTPTQENLPSSTQIETQVITPDPGLGKVHTYTIWDGIHDWVNPNLSVMKTLGGGNGEFGGNIGKSEYGIVTYGQWYAAALTSTFGSVGDMLLVVQDDGSVYPVMMADTKSQQVFDNGKYSDYNPANKWGHQDGQCIVEFEIAKGTAAANTSGNVPGPNNEFDHTITKVVNIGSLYDHPEYVTNVKQALIDANLSDVTFIDTGATTTSGVNANNLLGGTTTGGSSYITCPGSLKYYRPSNEIIESTDYKGGFIYKYYKSMFKDMEGVELNYAVENLIREIYEYKNALSTVVEKEKKLLATGNSSSLKCNITGDFESWLQTDSRWSSINLGNSSNTIGRSGCLVTSIAMLIKKSGTQLLIDDFNPGVFVQTMTANGGFQDALYANNDQSWSSIAPNFKQIEGTSVDIPLSGNREEKTQTLKKLLTEGYYLTVRVKSGSGQHWVALDRIEDDTVYMMDPASTATKLWDEKYEVAQTISYKKFKANDSAATTITSSGVCAQASGSYNYYNQAASNVNDNVHFGSYSPSCRPGKTLNEIGCSQMSLAIVASGLVSSDITPITVADAYCEVGINTAVSFSDVVNDSLMQKLQLSATPLFSESDSRESQKSKLQNILNNGYPVIINVTNRFVAVIPGNGGNVKLMDPGAIEKTKEYTMDEFDKVSWNGSTTWKSAYYFTKRS